MKICSVCKQELDLSNFYKKRNSHESFCKRCKDDKRKVRFAKDPSISKRLVEQRKQRLANNPDIAEAVRKYHADYYQRNKQKYDKLNTEWYKRNPCTRLLVQQSWRSRNLDVVRFHANKRRTSKLKATPAWVDEEWEQFVIEQSYNLAVLREEVTGFAWHVDHVVPLQSDIVCGLHCAANLQVIPATENIAKGNRWWPDMWD